MTPEKIQLMERRLDAMFNLLLCLREAYLSIPSLLRSSAVDEALTKADKWIEYYKRLEK